MNLYETPQAAEAALNSSRTIRVLDMRGGKQSYWACPEEAEHSQRPGLVLHRNRRGVVIGAMLVHVEEPSTARYISASAAGALRVQKLQCGHECYGLTNAAGAIIGG